MFRLKLLYENGNMSNEVGGRQSVRAGTFPCFSTDEPTTQVSEGRSKC